MYEITCPCHNIPRRLPADTLRTFWIGLENSGTQVLSDRPSEGHSLGVAVSLDDSRQAILRLPRPEVMPGEMVSLYWTQRTPPRTGPHRLRLDLVDESGEQQRSNSLLIDFETTKQVPTASSRMMDRACETNCWFTVPSRTVSWRSDGFSYPLFAAKAKGCRITDVEGRQYIDYLMGWGCALLGYGNKHLKRAVRNAMDSGAMLSLPHYLEMEVSEQLCAEIPCAEMVVFAKNGSDVCTAAVRMARAHTKRLKILTCGYHGWQDWFVERLGFDITGVPVRQEQLVLPFAFNNLEHFLQLMKANKGEVAAVMLEPAGPVEGVNGPLCDVDPGFLREVASITRNEGALLIFDEIVTGFRYPGGSVQRATGVIPDLACFGKALSAGMPLSALVGRREFFHSSMARIYFGPTFKSDVCSFAAAKEALALYKEHDVPGHICSFGNRLKKAVNSLSRGMTVPMEVIGPPFRMGLAFAEPDPHRAALMRTLVLQELVKKGVLTHLGFLIPSYAHDDRVLAETTRAFEHALQVLAEASKRDTFAQYLEIPPLT